MIGSHASYKPENEFFYDKGVIDCRFSILIIYKDSLGLHAYVLIIDAVDFTMNQDYGDIFYVHVLARFNILFLLFALKFGLNFFLNYIKNNHPKSPLHESKEIILHRRFKLQKLHWKLFSIC